MGFPEPNDPSLLDRVYLFLKSRLGCWATIACLFGGLLCAWGIGRGKLWAIVGGALLMAPYAIAALIFVPVIVGAVLFVFYLMATANWRERVARKNTKRKE